MEFSDINKLGENIIFALVEWLKKNNIPFKCGVLEEHSDNFSDKKTDDIFNLEIPYGELFNDKLIFSCGNKSKQLSINQKVMGISFNDVERATVVSENHVPKNYWSNCILSYITFYNENLIRQYSLIGETRKGIREISYSVIREYSSLNDFNTTLKFEKN